MPADPPPDDGRAGVAAVRTRQEDKITLRTLRDARGAGRKLAMLTCYDFTAARVLAGAGVPVLLVGDTAAVTVLGHDSTVRCPLDFLITLTEAVVRGAEGAFVMADMPFGSYHGDAGRAVENVCRMVGETGCDAVKLEVVPRQAPLVGRLADAGVAVCCHLGLRPQSAQASGYRTQGTTAESAREIVETAKLMESAGASLLLLEAVPPEVGRAVVNAVDLPVIGCGAGPAPVAHVVVLHDLLGQTPRQPRFVPRLPEASVAQTARAYVELIESGRYPAPEHCYSMRDGEAKQLEER